MSMPGADVERRPSSQCNPLGVAGGTWAEREGNGGGAPPGRVMGPVGAAPGPAAAIWSWARERALRVCEITLSARSPRQSR